MTWRPHQEPVSWKIIDYYFQYKILKSPIRLAPVHKQPNLEQALHEMNSLPEQYIRSDPNFVFSPANLKKEKYTTETNLVILADVRDLHMRQRAKFRN